MRRWTTLLALGSLTCALPGVSLAAEPQKYAVMPFSIGVNMADDMPKLLDELLLSALSKRAVEGQTFLGSSDITAVIGLEQQKAMLGCDDESCMAEIGNALGVDLLVAPAVGKLGDRFAITYKLIDPKTVKVIRRDTLVLTGDEGSLPEAMEQLADKILGLDASAQSIAPVAAAHEPGGGGTDASGEGEGGMSGLGWAGIGTLAVGGLVAIGGGVGVGLADLTLGDPASTGADKQGALTTYAVGLGGVGLGVLLLGTGAVLAALGG